MEDNKEDALLKLEDIKKRISLLVTDIKDLKLAEKDKYFLASQFNTELTQSNFWG